MSKHNQLAGVLATLTQEREAKHQAAMEAAKIILPAVVNGFGAADPNRIDCCITEDRLDATNFPFRPCSPQKSVKFDRETQEYYFLTRCFFDTKERVVLMVSRLSFVPDSMCHTVRINDRQPVSTIGNQFASLIDDLNFAIRENLERMFEEGAQDEKYTFVLNK